MESTPQDATRTIIVQHVVKAEALVQPKLRMEEGQTPSFIELADRLAVVVSFQSGKKDIYFNTCSNRFCTQVKLLPKVPPLTLKTEAEAAETTTPTATSTTADKPVAPMKNGTKPKAADGAASTGAASTASGPVSTTKDPSSVPILHRLACSSDEADAFAATLTSQLEQAGVMFSSAATKATKEAASVVRVVDRTGFPLWFKISANRPLGRLMRTYGQLKVSESRVEGHDAGMCVARSNIDVVFFVFSPSFRRRTLTDWSSNAEDASSRLTTRWRPCRWT